MALNTFRYNYLTPLHFKGLTEALIYNIVVWNSCLQPVTVILFETLYNFSNTCVTMSSCNMCVV